MSARPTLRVSLRVLLVLFVFICCGSAWLGTRIQQAARQRKAVDALTRMGAVVVFDYELENGELNGGDSPSPKWLIEICGEDLNSRVVEISFVHSDQVGDTTLELLRDLPTLVALDLQNTAISGGGMAHLEALTSLEELNLGNTDIGDHDVRVLLKLRSLAWLSLRDTHVSDSSADCLGELRQLKTLNISGTKITDRGLRQLSGLSNLEFLFAEETRISQKGVEEFSHSLPDCHVKLH